MKTSITVKGTHCESCKALIEDVLKDIDGVNSATADFKTGKTEIEHTKKLSKKVFVIAALLLAILIPASLFAYSESQKNQRFRNSDIQILWSTALSLLICLSD